MHSSSSKFLPNEGHGIMIIIAISIYVWPALGYTHAFSSLEEIARYGFTGGLSSSRVHLMRSNVL